MFYIQSFRYIILLILGNFLFNNKKKININNLYITSPYINKIFINFILYFFNGNIDLYLEIIIFFIKKNINMLDDIINIILNIKNDLINKNFNNIKKNFLNIKEMFNNLNINNIENINKYLSIIE
ncbi:hypothetical protein [Candidatus Nardonella dryophthoridicola]|uniref:Uncharacterized protein n=1 Tax=endosymbiont of Metamasius hemipterus TaxID=204627 RepID=A0ABT0TWG0_9GAMM|nr:hypothetical protein [Candidatus Nardonella dryophthoridicola]MCM0158336.1 hypothetical protein [endosymbiont of Metamasius hemipterus]